MLFKPEIPTELNSKSGHCTGLVACEQHWGHTDECADFQADVISQRVCNPELCCPLGVADVVYLINPSLFNNEIDVCREIVNTHLMEREVPKLLIVICHIYVLE